MFMCLVLGSPKLGKWSHMWLHQGCRGEKDDLYQPAVNGLPNAVKDAVVFWYFLSQGEMLVYFQLYEPKTT